MSDDHTFHPAPQQSGTGTGVAFLSPPVCAVAGMVLAVAALLGQNVVTVGFSTVLASGLGPGGESFYIGWGVATAVQVGLVLLLARRSLVLTDGWEATLARASVLVAGVALVAAVLVVVGGMMTGSPVGF
jgi:hypothetical protein